MIFRNGSRSADAPQELIAMDLSCREFEDRDWPDMVRFYKQFYREDYIFTQRKFFDWNFSSPLRPDSRSGQRLILDGEKIVGIMGMLPWPIQLNGRMELGEYNINLYLDATYRGQGMGQRLLESVCSGYRYSMSNGYATKTLTMYQRIGHVHEWQMARFVRPIQRDACHKLLETSSAYVLLEDTDRCALVKRLEACAARELPSQVSTVERVTRFDARWDEAWEALRGLYGVTTWRSSAFLNWRYIDYPYPLYHCFVTRGGSLATGMIALRLETPATGNVVRIVDLIAGQGDTEGLLSHAEAFARSHEAIFIDYIQSQPRETALLDRTGYADFADAQGVGYIPMDLNPIRHRQIRCLITLVDPQHEARSAEIENGSFYFVKGDGDQDRAN
jgi:GNAT superfamily N-acetyltransferase